MTDYATLARIEDHLRRIADALERIPTVTVGELDAKPCDDRTCTDRDHWAPPKFNPGGYVGGDYVIPKLPIRGGERVVTRKEIRAELRGKRVNHGSTPTACVHGQDHPDSLTCEYATPVDHPRHPRTKGNRIMTDLTPADLAKFVHPVPVGATIPAGMEVMEFSRNSGYFRGPFRYTQTCTQLADEPPRWTAEPLAAPKPPLPTEVGAVIANVVPAFDGRDPEPSDTCAVMVRGAFGQWFGVDANGYARSYSPNQIADWTPARIVTDEADR